MLLLKIILAIILLLKNTSICHLITVSILIHQYFIY